MGLSLVVAIVAAGLVVEAPSPAVAAPVASAAAPGGTFAPLTPVRVLDTRTQPGPVGPDSTITLDLSDNLPSSATAVVLNLTGTGPTEATWVTVYPHGETRPGVSSLNLAPGQTRPNSVTVGVGAERKLALYNQAGSVHLIADLAGYYSTGPGSKYTPVQAHRVMDTRKAWEPDPIPGGTITLDLGSHVPPSATAVTFNLIATEAAAGTWITAFPSGQPRPNVSNLNLVAGETAANHVTVALGADRKVSLYNQAGSLHLIADLHGFYAPDFGALFVPVEPTRVLDTRDGTGTWETGPISPGKTISNRLPAIVPEAATAAVLNLTGTGPTSVTFLSAWENHNTHGPYTSSLNLAAGQTAANMIMPSLSLLAGAPDDPEVMKTYYVTNNSGSVHAVADLAGYFVLPPSDCQTGCVHTWSYWAWPHPGAGTLSAARPVSGLSGVVAVAGEPGHGLALVADGTVRQWGRYAGEANGWLRASWSPVPVRGLTSVTAIAAGWPQYHALRSDGTVYEWGARFSLQPKQVPGLTGVTAISANWDIAYALRSDGTVWAWGVNNKGQLGNGSTAEKSEIPVQVTALTGVTAIGSGLANGYAVKADGTVWSWGDNSEGQLGNGAMCDTCLSRTPVQVSGLSGAKAVAGGFGHAFALRNDGTVVGWGDNEGGGLGNGLDCEPFSNGPNCRSTVPVPVSGLSAVKAISTFHGGGHAVKNDGTAWSWGSNRSHELGDPGSSAYPNYRTKPVRVAGLTGVTAITAGLALVS